MKKLLLVLMSLLVYGCIAGGVLIKHQKPNMYFGKSTEFTLELSVNAGNASKAFKQAVLIYKYADAEFRSQPMTVSEANEMRVIFKTLIAPIAKSDGENRLFEYYFKYSSDEDTYFYPEKAYPLTIGIKPVSKN